MAGWRQQGEVLIIERAGDPLLDDHFHGPHPSSGNLDQLAEAIATDEYRWVLYWAARSLAEAAAKVSNPRRQRALDSLSGFVAGERGGKARPVILQEIVEACFVDDYARGWGNAAIPLLEQMLARVAPDLKRALTERVASFRRVYLTDRRPVDAGPALGISAAVEKAVQAAPADPSEK